MPNDKDDMRYRKGIKNRVFDPDRVMDYEELDDRDDDYEDDEYTIERTEREIREDEEGGLKLIAILFYMTLGAISTLIILGIINLIF